MVNESADNDERRPTRLSFYLRSEKLIAEHAFDGNAHLSTLKASGLISGDFRDIPIKDSESGGKFIHPIEMNVTFYQGSTNATNATMSLAPGRLSDIWIHGQSIDLIAELPMERFEDLLNICNNNFTRCHTCY